MISSFPVLAVATGLVMAAAAATSLSPGSAVVILDRNPLTVDPAEIKDIRVLSTIKQGMTIYHAR